MNSRTTSVSLDGLPTPEAKRRITEWLEETGTGRAGRHLQAARLAVQPPAVLGRAVPDRLRRATTSRSRCPSRCCRSSCPRSTDFEPRILADDDAAAAGAAARTRRRLGDRRARPRRRAEALPARDEHDAAVGGLVLVLPALPRPDERERRSSIRDVERYWMGDGTRRRASTSTSAAPSTRCCTCSTRASGTRCSSTSATCRRPSRSTGSTTRARSPPPRTPTSAACTSRRARSRSATASTSTTAQPVTRQTGRWARA